MLGLASNERHQGCGLWRIAVLRFEKVADPSIRSPEASTVRSAGATQIESQESHQGKEGEADKSPHEDEEPEKAGHTRRCRLGCLLNRAPFRFHRFSRQRTF